VNHGSEGADVDTSVVEGAAAGNVVSVTVEAVRLDGGGSDGAGLVDLVEERTDKVAGASASSSSAHPANVNTNTARIVPRLAADTARTVTLNPGARCRIAVGRYRWRAGSTPALAGPIGRASSSAVAVHEAGG
jgi:hypothetical protein